MKGMTIYPHFAALIAEGVKTIEGRTWQRSYRGPLAIHCATSWGQGGFRACRDWLLSDECPVEVWNELLRARNSQGDPYVTGPERVALRRPRRWGAPEGDVHEPAFERGHIVALAIVNRIIPPAELPPDVYEHEAPLCDFEYMTHAWILDNLTRLDDPVQVPTRDHNGRVRNFQGLWNVPDDIADELLVAPGRQRPTLTHIYGTGRVR